MLSLIQHSLLPNNRSTIIVYSETDQLSYLNYEDQSSHSVAQFQGTSLKLSPELESALAGHMNELASQ